MFTYLNQRRQDAAQRRQDADVDNATLIGCLAIDTFSTAAFLYCVYAYTITNLVCISLGLSRRIFWP